MTNEEVIKKLDKVEMNSDLLDLIEISKGKKAGQVTHKMSEIIEKQNRILQEKDKQIKELQVKYATQGSNYSQLLDAYEVVQKQLKTNLSNNGIELY